MGERRRAGPPDRARRPGSVSRRSSPPASGLEEQLVGIVVVAVELGVTAPRDGGVELLLGEVADLVPQLVEEVVAVDPPVVVLPERLPDAQDRGDAEHTARDELLAREDRRFRVGLAERRDQDVALLDL